MARCDIAKLYTNQADNQTVWVMQGWFLEYDASFWQPPQTKAFLSGIPDNGLIMLDLVSLSDIFMLVLLFPVGRNLREARRCLGSKWRSTHQVSLFPCISQNCEQDFISSSVCAKLIIL